MRFFIHLGSGDDEADYRALAQLAARAPAGPARRIQAIEFDHDGVRWRAEVGQPLSGKRHRRARRQGKTVDVVERRSDPAEVRAIFAGDPYAVVTTKRPLGPHSSEWANPFWAGVPVIVQYFDPPEVSAEYHEAEND